MAGLRLIVGLGNPGPEYAGNRHNIGFMAVDEIVRRHGFGSPRARFHGVTAEGTLGGEKVVALKPQTYMNLSGSVLRAYPRREGFDVAQDLLVIVDEVAIPCGEFRFRPFGSAGGHNGLKSVEAHLKTQKYPRLRIGVRSIDERRLGGDLADYVLNVMPRDERELVDAIFSRMVTAVEVWVKEGTDKAVSTMGR